MTEAEWLTCTNPDTMLYFLQTSAGERKMRLFAAACCRRIWHLMTDERSRRLVEVAERHIEDQASNDEWREASTAAREAWSDSGKLIAPELYGLARESRTPEETTAFHILHSTTSAAHDLAHESMRAIPGHEGRAVAHAVAREAARAVQRDGDQGFDANYSRSPERPCQCVLLRDIVGNPFRPVSLD